MIAVRVALLALVSLLLPLQESLPPAYPRPGATAMLDNDDVIVWNIAWLQQEYPVHRHRYDHIGVYYTNGDRIITSVDGERRPVSTQAWNISFQLAGVTHAEAGASVEPLRAVFVQIKRPTRGETSRGGGQDVFPLDGPAQRLDNDRVSVWDYGATAAARRSHRHAHDAAVVSFDAAGAPSVRWVQRGSVHESDVPPGAPRTFVFEIK